MGVQVSQGGARSPVLRITTPKWWSPAVLPVTLKLLLGKGRKSQQQIHIPNSSRATPLSVETVGQKWRETKHASHVAAPSAWASWEVASHSQPFCWGHFSSNLMSSICTLGRGWGFRESWFLLQPSSSFGCNSDSELSLIYCLLPQAEIFLPPLHKIIACYNHFAQVKPSAALSWLLLTRSNHPWLSLNKVLTYHKDFSRDVMQSEE